MKTAVLYFNGTGVKAGSHPSLVNTLHAMTVQNNDQFTDCADGNCSNGQGPLDVAQAKGLQEEVNTSTQMIRDMQKEAASGEKIRVVLVGFSRGAITALKAALDVKDISPDSIELHVCGVDPVTGESSAHAAYPQSWTKAVSDLRQCTNLTSIQLLYASESQQQEIQAQTNVRSFSLSNLVGAVVNSYAGLCFNAVKPLLPAGLKGDIGAHPGSHVEMQSMQIDSYGKISPTSDKSLITFHRVVRFLLRCGVEFDPNLLQLDERLKIDNTDALITAMRRECAAINSTSTYNLHNGDSVHVGSFKNYLNPFHQRIEGVNEDPSLCSLHLAYSGTPLLQQDGVQLAWAGAQFVDGVIAQHREMINGTLGIEIPADDTQRYGYYAQHGTGLYSSCTGGGEQPTNDSSYNSLLPSLSSLTLSQQPGGVLAQNGGLSSYISPQTTTQLQSLANGINAVTGMWSHYTTGGPPQSSTSNAEERRLAEEQRRLEEEQKQIPKVPSGSTFSDFF